VETEKTLLVAAGRIAQTVAKTQVRTNSHAGNEFDKIRLIAPASCRWPKRGVSFYLG
jgi:hypothetical protein